MEPVKGHRAVTRPHSFIFTVFGDFVHAYGDAIWVGSLVRLMAEFGLSEQAVRAALSRMSRQGWVESVRGGGRSYYSVTELGKRRVDEVSKRIYLPPRSDWDGKWRMVTYTIPETMRDLRDRLRKDLTVLGLGPLSASLWISPRDVAAALEDAAESHGLRDRVDFFLAEYRGPLTDAQLVRKCWDLDAIAAAYDDFIRRYGGRRKPLSDVEAFVTRIWLVHDFRKFAYLDPGLPPALLPRDWPGERAGALFREFYASLLPAAVRFFESVFSAPAEEKSA
jgi:phenylacetic acid degradation operon negative regulatory protein